MGSHHWLLYFPLSLSFQPWHRGLGLYVPETTQLFPIPDPSPPNQGGQWAIVGPESILTPHLCPQLQSTGRLLEEQLPEMMTELLASARDKMLCPSESMLTRSLLLEVIELHANSWNPLTPPITQYYNRTIQKLTA